MSKPLLLLYVIASTTMAFAHPRHPCDEALTVPPVINRTVMPFHSKEIDRAGILVPPGEKLPSLRTGTYLFLISRDQELMVAAVCNIPALLDGASPLVTHKSLVEQYRQITGQDIENRVVAAGGFVNAFDHAMMVHNRSGNFRGGSDHLNYAVQMLNSCGLITTPSTRVLTFNPNNASENGHSDRDRDFATFQMDVIREVYQHPYGRRILLLYEKLARLLLEISPGLDPTGIIVDVYKDAISLKRQGGLFRFLYPLSTATTVDGMHFGVWKLWFSEGENPGGFTIEPSPRYHMATILIAKQGHITKEQADALLQLGREFDALQSPP